MPLSHAASAAIPVTVAPFGHLSRRPKHCVSAWLEQGHESFFSCRLLRSRTPVSGAGDANSGRNWKRANSFRKSLAMAAVENQDIQKKVTVVKNDGLKLAGKLKDTKSKDVVVICHGFQSSKDSVTLSGVADSIVKSGTSTFQFDFTGNGESDGEFAYGNYWHEVEDLRAVILYLRAEGRNVSAIIGHSKGGNVVVLYASKYGDVSQVINVCGRFDLRIGVEDRFGKSGLKKLHEQGYVDVKDKAGNVEYRATLESLNDRLATDMDAASRSIPKDVRVFTIHGSADETIDVGDAQEFANRIPNHAVKIIEGANHNYEGKQAELNALAVAFLQGNLSKI